MQENQSNSFLIILLSILLLISCIIAGFFAFQTQKLVNELRVTRDELTQTPTPTAEPIVTPDPTADWKTYTNTKFNYSFRYPFSWKILFEDMYEYSNVEIGTEKSQRIGAFHFTGKPESDKESHIKSFQLSNQDGYIMITFSRCPSGPGVDCGGAQSVEDKELFSQILSTFKFTN